MIGRSITSPDLATCCAMVRPVKETTARKGPYGRSLRLETRSLWMVLILSLLSSDQETPYLGDLKIPGPSARAKPRRTRLKGIIALTSVKVC